MDNKAFDIEQTETVMADEPEKCIKRLVLDRKVVRVLKVNSHLQTGRSKNSIMPWREP